MHSPRPASWLRSRQAVADYLDRHGIAEQRLAVTGAGSPARRRQSVQALPRIRRTDLLAEPMRRSSGGGAAANVRRLVPRGYPAGRRGAIISCMPTLARLVRDHLMSPASAIPPLRPAAYPPFAGTSLICLAHLRERFD